jgi:DNA gyrase/topoisomerase IV subunit B
LFKSQPVNELIIVYLIFYTLDVSIVKQTLSPIDHHQQQHDNSSTQVKFYLENSIFDNEAKYALNGLVSVLEENYSHDDLPIVTSTSESESEYKQNSPIMFPQKIHSLNKNHSNNNN